MPPTTRTDVASGGRGRLLITAGPTHEPIDAVRFIGNRSSGRLGSALATEAASRGWSVTLLMGPGGVLPGSGHNTIDSQISVVRFRTAADLQGLLREHAPRADVLVMAAAVADFRPKTGADVFGGKFRRKHEDLVLALEPTPDLLAEVASTRRPEQLMVGFALEPREEMLSSAQEKLERKKVDLVVANPLETMDSDSIEAVVIGRGGFETRTPGKISKGAFAPWLMDLIDAKAASHGRGA